MKLKKNICILIISILIYSCGPLDNKKQGALKNVSLICLRDNDTVYVRITNKTDSTIYIPKNYCPDYTVNSDTLHFEVVNKAEYGVNNYYRYKSIFPFDFYTTEKIKNYVPDTIVMHKEQTYFYNQFRIQQFLLIKPDSSHIMKLQFDVPNHAKIVQAVYYDKPFLNKNALDKAEYSLSDFLKFDSTYVKKTDAPILTMYRK